jgi:hypothetical protein
VTKIEDLRKQKYILSDVPLVEGDEITIEELEEEKK